MYKNHTKLSFTIKIFLYFALPQGGIGVRFYLKRLLEDSARMALKKHKFEFLEVGFHAQRPTIVNTRSNSIFRWDSWGVRDVAVLSGPRGEFIHKNNLLSLYYTGSTRKGSIQQTGLLYYDSQKRRTVKSFSSPVLKVSKNSWDSAIASTSWVLFDQNQYFMYYRGGSHTESNNAIGLAFSDDGINFNKFTGNPILTPTNFQGIPNSKPIMGVLNATVSKTGRHLILFEAPSVLHDGRTQIFGAVASEGFNFLPLNDGWPIFTANNVTSWPVKAVSNPRLTLLQDGTYLMTFNGSMHGEYSIGAVMTHNLEDWTEHSSNPILVPSGWPADLPFTNRLEGACFDIKQMQGDQKYFDCFFMTIPLGSLNHHRAVNAVCSIEKKKIDPSEMPFKFISQHSSSVVTSKEKVILRPFFEQCKFVQGNITLQKKPTIIELNLKTICNKNVKSLSYLCLTDSFGNLGDKKGIFLKFDQNSVLINKPNGSFKQRLIHLLFQQFYRVTRKLFWIILLKNLVPFAPKFGWTKIFENDLHRKDNEFNFQISMTLASDKIYVAINGVSIEIENILLDENSRILTLAAFKGEAIFSKLKIQ